MSSLMAQDGRLSILRLEQLLKEKITSNKTFQMKHATGAMGGTSRDTGISDSLALAAHAEVNVHPRDERGRGAAALVC